MVTKYLLPCLAVASLSTITVDNVYASSSFNSSAAISYTIDSVVNTTGVTNDLAGLSITGGFSLDPFSSYIDIPAGSDGVATPLASIQDVYIDPVSGSFAKTLNVSGNVGNGKVDASYLGFFDLIFDNSSSNNFDIQVTLNYSLSAAATGQFAESGIQMDFFNEAGGFDSGVSGYSVYSAAPFSSETLTNSVIYNFTLAAGSLDALYVDVGVFGNIEASPVPLPGSFGLFLSALVLPVIRRLRKSFN